MTGQALEPGTIASWVLPRRLSAHAVFAIRGGCAVLLCACACPLFASGSASQKRGALPGGGLTQCVRSPLGDASSASHVGTEMQERCIAACITVADVQLAAVPCYINWLAKIFCNVAVLLTATEMQE
jgi:hypothetical protein